MPGDGVRTAGDSDVIIVIIIKNNDCVYGQVQTVK